MMRTFAAATLLGLVSAVPIHEASAQARIIITGPAAADIAALGRLRHGYYFLQDHCYFRTSPGFIEVDRSHCVWGRER
jgi:hypothetical protein